MEIFLKGLRAVISVVSFVINLDSPSRKFKGYDKCSVCSLVINLEMAALLESLRAMISVVSVRSLSIWKWPSRNLEGYDDSLQIM